jgi:hypothetical protein
MGWIYLCISLMLRVFGRFDFEEARKLFDQTSKSCRSCSYSSGFIIDFRLWVHDSHRFFVKWECFSNSSTLIGWVNFHDSTSEFAFMSDYWQSC